MPPPDVVTKPADPTREGYTFGGWYVDEACTQAFDFGARVDSDMTLHAKWVANGSGETPTPDPEPDQPTSGTATDPATGITASGSVLADGGSAAGGKAAGTTLTKTGDSLPVVPIACFGGGGRAAAGIWPRSRAGARASNA